MPAGRRVASSATTPTVPWAAALSRHWVYVSVAGWVAASSVQLSNKTICPQVPLHPAPAGQRLQPEQDAGGEQLRVLAVGGQPAVSPCMCSWARTRAALLAHVGAFGLHAVRALQPLPPSWPSAQVACPPAWIRWLAPEVLAGERHTLASVSARSCSGREPWTILSLLLPPAALPAPGTDWSVTLPLLPAGRFLLRRNFVGADDVQRSLGGDDQPVAGAQAIGGSKGAWPEAF